MSDGKTETSVKSADLVDKLTGNVGDNGEELKNGHPVMETKPSEEDESEEDESEEDNEDDDKK